MIVGEAWGKEEDERGEPFVGASGSLLNSMLHDAGLMRSDVFVSNVVNRRPEGNKLKAWIPFSKKDQQERERAGERFVEWKGLQVLPLVLEGYNQLRAEIEMVQPNVIVPVGNLALHALVPETTKKGPKGVSGITKWRGSHLRMDCPPTLIQRDGAPKVIPTIHPAAVLREWSYRATVVNDLRRVARNIQSRIYEPPERKFIIRPNFSQTIDALERILTRLDAGEDFWITLDKETRAGHTACTGISWSKTEGVVIPQMCIENRDGYWSLEEEGHIVWLMYRVLTHPKAKVRGQNLLYDAQYTWRHWHFVPRVHQDTMISHHTVWSDLPKALAFQASMYCHWYVYWKDEGKTWDTKLGEDQLWAYNGEDLAYTDEVGEVELKTIEAMTPTWPQLPRIHAFQQAMFWPVLRAMQIGLRVRKEVRSKLAGEVQEQIDLRQSLLNAIVGYEINVDSPKQMQDLFYAQLQQSIVWKREPGEPPRPTCDDDALTKIARREPLMKPLTNCIADLRTLNGFLGDFILAPLDLDGRMRCSYNIGGSESGKSAPKTYRLSSSKNAFGSGANLQNIPSEKSKSVGKAAARGHLAMLGDPYHLPNIRSLYGPDSGFTFWDMDLDRADLQVVVWEADDAMLKAALRAGADIHLLNAFVLNGKEPPPMDELVEGHPRYPDHRGPYKTQREFAKVFCHGTNYLGGARTMAGHLGRTVHEVERAQKIWFGAHPGIQRWHTEVSAQINKRRYVENKFGYRWYIFDRIDSALSEAVAWIPQSTVSIVINKIWMNLFQDRPEAEWDLSPEHMYKLFTSYKHLVPVLLQVHDSLGGQFPTHRREESVTKLKSLSSILIPYDDPLVIPTGIGTSEITWGEC